MSLKREIKLEIAKTMQQDDFMQYETVLPEGFDGTFRFTNWTDEDFVGVWNGRQYTFPANSTSPIVMSDETPLQIQQIRKKFAKDLAEREYFKSEQYKTFVSREAYKDGTPIPGSVHRGVSYNDTMLSSYIQKCLEPLAITNAKVSVVPKQPLEEILTRNEDGELNTEAIDKKVSLRDKALKAGSK